MDWDSTLTDEQKLSLEVDEFVKETNKRLLDLSARAESFNISLDLRPVQYSVACQIVIAKEYLIGEEDEQE